MCHKKKSLTVPNEYRPNLKGKLIVTNGLRTFNTFVVSQ